MTTSSMASAGRRFDWDLFEKVAVATLLLFLAYRLIAAVVEHGEYLNLLLLAAESIGVFFILVRRRTADLSQRSADWVLGFGGTILPLLVMPPTGGPLAPVALCAALMTVGFLIQFGAKLTLRRSFGVIAANRGVKVSGPYRLVRHPMYLGYVVTHIGFLLSGPSAWNLCIYALTAILFIVRIEAEERLLLEDPAYQELTRRVRYRLVPYLY